MDIGNWDVPTFLFSYMMVFLFPIIFISWKLIKKTKWLKPEEVILRTSEVDEIDEYTKNYIEQPATSRWNYWLDKLFG